MLHATSRLPTLVAAKLRFLEKEEYYTSLLERQAGTLLPLLSKRGEVTMTIHSAILDMQDLSSTLKIVSLVAEVSAGSSVVNSVNMVNPVLKKNDKWERKMS